MSENNIASLISGCVAHINNYILSPVVSYLQNKGVVVSVDELSNILQLPHIRPVLPLMTSHNIPVPIPYLKKPVSTPIKSCRYQYKRGKDKGQFCPKPATTGSDFCNSCIKRNSLVKEPTTDGSLSPVIFNGDTPQGQLNVVEYDSTRSLYKELTYNFIICQIKQGVIAVIGYLNGDEIIPLTTEQKLIAQKIGLIVSDKTRED